MKFEFRVQDGILERDSIATLLASLISKHSYDSIYAAMAYVTIAGVRDILGSLASPPRRSQWLVGLDDFISQPGAIDLCEGIQKSELRVASLAHENRRFHPKVLLVSDSKHSFHSFMIQGSANLTKQGLRTNAESIVVMHADSEEDRKLLQIIWQKSWKLGRKLSAGELDSYRIAYEKKKRARRRELSLENRKAKRQAIRKVLDDDVAEVDPTNASVCWIECGNVTAMGRELEFKAEQGLFFGLNPHGENPRTFHYLVSSGELVPLRMKYQGNHMWRLQMSNEVPEVAAGLRPMRNGRLSRSPFVAVFVRESSPAVFKLYFVRLRSKEFKALRQKSIAKGTLGRTISREYGWF